MGLHRIVALAIALLGNTLLVQSRPTEFDAQVKWNHTSVNIINMSSEGYTRLQTMEGFGVSLCWWAVGVGGWSNETVLYLNKTNDFIDPSCSLFISAL